MSEMHKLPYTLSRNVRLVLLLLLLAAKSIAAAHEYCPDHESNHQDCSICVLGHSLGSALEVFSPAPLPLRYTALQMPSYMAGHVVCSLGIAYFSRAPPDSHRSL